MRSREEVVQAICEQVVHGIKRCGWDDSTTEAFDECIDKAIEMTVTFEELEVYDGLWFDVKMSIVL